MSYRQRKKASKKARERKIERTRRRIAYEKSAGERKKRGDRKKLEESLIPKIGKRCELSESGRVSSLLLTPENLDVIKDAITRLGVEISEGEDLSQEEYCKIFRAYIFKREKCDGRVCCQAITEEGDRCHRPASRLFTFDLTDKAIAPEIPKFLEKRLGKEKVQELRLSGFAITCCFYCWQHAAMYGTEIATWSSNLAYYLTHPEDILNVFYENVEVTRRYRFLPFTYKYEISGLRTSDEIIKNMFAMAATMAGKATFFYWIVMAMVWLYDILKNELLKVIAGDEEDAEEHIEAMAIVAADALLRFNDLDMSRIEELREDEEDLVETINS